MALLNETILCLITVLHLIVLIFIVGAPFSNSNYLLLMHIMIVPFIMFHWYLNNNTCSLTLAEKFIREKTYGQDIKDNDCFTYQFIAPIYDFNKNHEDYSSFTWFITFGLWLVSVYNLGNKYNSGQITKFEDFYKL
jgi:hypothetical protein